MKGKFNGWAWELIWAITAVVLIAQAVMLLAGLIVWKIIKFEWVIYLCGAASFINIVSNLRKTRNGHRPE